MHALIALLNDGAMFKALSLGTSGAKPGVGFAMMTAIIAGACTIIGAMAAKAVERDGLAFWRRAERIRCSGTGVELETFGPLSTYPDSPGLKAGPKGRDDIAYDLRDCTLKIRASRCWIDGHMLMKQSGQTLAEGRITGSGRYEDGYAFMIYRMHDPVRSQEWTGLCLLRASRLGDLQGFWMCRDHLQIDDVATGSVSLQRC